MSADSMTILPESLLGILQCPVCRAQDFDTDRGNEVKCRRCDTAYPIVDSVLDMVCQTGNDLCDQVTGANIVMHDSCASSYEGSDLNQIYSPESFAGMEATVMELAQKHGGGRLLDVGCGTGFVLRVSESHFQERYGIDVSIDMLKLATRFGAYLVRASAYSIPFEDEAFDVTGLWQISGLNKRKSL
jgi:SAM-dependent methyltransferase